MPLLCRGRQVEAFWVVMPCSVVVGYQCSGIPCCLNLQGEVIGGLSPSHFMNDG
jgi:hypothetical protein